MTDRSLEQLKRALDEWEEALYHKSATKLPEREREFTTASFVPVKALYTPLDVPGDYASTLGFPGRYPFTRGIQPTMYRGRLWTMRQYAGFGTAKESNARYRYLLGQGQSSAALTITGSMPDFAFIRSIPVAEGRYPNWDDERQVRRVAFLGSDAKKQLFGSRPALGETIRVGDFPYTVVGVMRHKEQDSSYDGRDIGKVFLPFSAILRDFPNKPPFLAESVDRLLVAPRSVGEHEACKGELRRALGRIHGFDSRDEEAAHIWDTIEEAKAFQTMTDGMKYFLGAVGVATLFIGGIGVMNVMLVAVRERTREIEALRMWPRTATQAFQNAG